MDRKDGWIDGFMDNGLMKKMGWWSNWWKDWLMDWMDCLIGGWWLDEWVDWFDLINGWTDWSFNWLFGWIAGLSDWTDGWIDSCVDGLMGCCLIDGFPTPLFFRTWILKTRMKIPWTSWKARRSCPAVFVKGITGPPAVPIKTLWVPCRRSWLSSWVCPLGRRRRLQVG